MLYEEDLQKLFVGEVEERTGRLLAGAEALTSGPLAPEALRDLVREGHTLKGTARMMGFTAISDAGKALEEAWRAISNGEVQVDEEVVSALALLATQMA